MKIRHRIEEKNGKLKEAYVAKGRLKRAVCYVPSNVFYSIYSKCKKNDEKTRRVSYDRVSHSILNKKVRC